MIGLVDAASRLSSLSRAELHAVWSPLADAAVVALIDNVEVDLMGLGHLRVVLRPERLFVHPLTDQEMLMPAERLLMLTPSPALFCAANPSWSPEDAATAIVDALPEAWDDREVLDLVGLLIDHPHADPVIDGILDAVIAQVVDAASAHRDDVLVVDGMGHLRLTFKEGWIGVHPGTLKPLIHRGRALLNLEPGLALRAGLIVQG